MDYYVYSYHRLNGTPWYIGKGRGIRAWYKSTNEYISPPKDKKYIVMVERNLTEIGALALERRLIRWYGRKDNGTGILRNMTDGGDGCSGRIMSHKTKELLRKRNLEQVAKGTFHSLGPKYNEKMLANGIHSSQIKKTCPNCKKTMSIPNYIKYDHGEDCKPKTCIIKVIEEVENRP
jgi:hypothetical protein